MSNIVNRCHITIISHGFPLKPIYYTEGEDSRLGAATMRSGASAFGLDHPAGVSQGPHWYLPYRR